MKNVSINFEIAYMVYEFVYDRWSELSETEKKKARRQVESTMREAGFNGVSTGLVSVKALETIVNEKKGIEPSRKTRQAIEHPITYTNIARFCLEADTKMTRDEYLKVWFDNLITTVTTNEENQYLRNFQENFRFGVDCWRKMYEAAGIQLVEKPNFRRNDVKRQYGIM
jgi:hypothetical protein